MKRIILLILVVFISVTVYAQQNSSLFERNKYATELKIYPNPCKGDKITVELKSHQIAEIQLTNITGKLVFKKKFNFAENKKQLQFNDIPNGIYLLKVNSVNNKIMVKKLIISRE